MAADAVNSHRSYSLKYNDFTQNLTSAFDTLRCQQDLVDVTLCCEGQKIPAHKMLLAASSSYFNDLFKDIPCQHPVIVFRNTALEDLKALVNFMYKGEVCVRDCQLESFLETAKLLQIQGLSRNEGDAVPIKIEDEEEQTEVLQEIPSQNSNDYSPPRSPAASKKRKGSFKLSTSIKRERISVPSNGSSQKSDSEHESVIDSERQLLQAEEELDEEQIAIRLLDAREGAEEDEADNESENINADDMQNSGEAAEEDEDDHSLNLNDMPRLQPECLLGKTERCDELDSPFDKANKEVKVLRANDKFICSACGTIFDRYNACWDHTNQHVGTTTCKECSRVFATKYGLRRHIEAVHPAKKIRKTPKKEKA